MKLHFLFWFIFVSIILFINCTHHKIMPRVYSCSDSLIICNNNSPNGKIFYKSDSINYSNKFNITILNRKDIGFIDSIIKSYVISQIKTTDKIKNNYESYFKQYLPYEDLNNDTKYIKITYHRTYDLNPRDYVFKYWTLVDDGGDDFFYVKFDWSNKKIAEYYHN